MLMKVLQIKPFQRASESLVKMLSTSLRSKSGDKTYPLSMDTWATFSICTQTNTDHNQP